MPRAQAGRHARALIKPSSTSAPCRPGMSTRLVSHADAPAGMPNCSAAGSASDRTRPRVARCATASTMHVRPDRWHAPSHPAADEPSGSSMATVQGGWSRIFGARCLVLLRCHTGLVAMLCRMRLALVERDELDLRAEPRVQLLQDRIGLAILRQVNEPVLRNSGGRLDRLFLNWPPSTVASRIPVENRPPSARCL